MKNRREIWILIGVVIVAALAFKLRGGSPVNREAMVDDVREAVVRYMMAHNDWNAREEIGTYFLRLEMADPSDAFLHRFDGSKPPVDKASKEVHARSLDRRNGISVHTADGKPGLDLSVARVAWNSDTQATVIAGWSQNPMRARGKVYTVDRVSGQWVVDKETP
jgi:hypothetical protein